MGLYPSGMNPVVDHAGIAAAMQPALYAWFPAHIQIYDPQEETRGVYNPQTDSWSGSSVPTVIYDSGPQGALVSPIRLSTPTSFGEQLTGIQGLHFQVKRFDQDVTIRSGLLVKVLDGGNDKTTEDFVYAILDGQNSSLTWGHTYQARVVNS